MWRCSSTCDYMLQCDGERCCFDYMCCEEGALLLQQRVADERCCFDYMRRGRCTAAPTNVWLREEGLLNARGAVLEIDGGLLAARKGGGRAVSTAHTSVVLAHAHASSTYRFCAGYYWLVSREFSASSRLETRECRDLLLAQLRARRLRRSRGRGER